MFWRRSDERKGGNKPQASNPEPAPRMVVWTIDSFNNVMEHSEVEITGYTSLAHFLLLSFITPTDSLHSSSSSSSSSTSLSLSSSPSSSTSPAVSSSKAASLLALLSKSSPASASPSSSSSSPYSFVPRVPVPFLAPDPAVAVGSRVLATWTRSVGRLYPATVAAVNADGTYVVHFDDGDLDSHCPISHIKSLMNDKDERGVNQHPQCSTSGWKCPRCDYDDNEVAFPHCCICAFQKGADLATGPQGTEFKVSWNARGTPESFRVWFEATAAEKNQPWLYRILPESDKLWEYLYSEHVHTHLSRFNWPKDTPCAVLFEKRRTLEEKTKLINQHLAQFESTLPRELGRVVLSYLEWEDWPLGRVTAANAGTWRQDLIEGDHIDALDTVSKWYASTIQAVSDVAVKVSYDGWSSKWDEWIERTSCRLAPLHTHTAHPINVLRDGKRPYPSY